ncbi:MAG: hypothetical protein JXD19_04185, partial [Deltaproteobacteria bacterium]|nr:hypothetical protein [Deltaproteobacteria bacterium]
VNRRIFHVFYDMVFIALAYTGSFFILYEDASYEFVRHIVFQTFPLILVIKVTTFYLFGLYRRSWRYTNIADFLRLSQSILASFVVCVVIFNFSFVPAVSFRIFLIDCLLLLVMASATRASFRILEYVKKREQKEGETVVIYGAGRGGAFALREFLSNTNLKVIPVGFIDDEQTKVGRLINGYPVLGTIEDLPAIIDKQRPSQVIVSTLKIPLERIQAVKRFGQENNIRVKRFRITFEEL